MKQNSRQRRILDYLKSHDELSVEQACVLLNASPATVRRDFVELSSQNKVEKIWGGITSKPQKEPDAKSLFYRQTHHVEEKMAIARIAASLVKDGDVIMIDGGTTTREMATLLVGRRIRIITNSLLIANQIHLEQKGWQGMELFLTGGLLYPDSGMLVGPGACKTISEYHADWAFLSSGGINEQGIFNTNQLVVETEKEMIRQSQQAAVLADFSKFGNRSMTKLCDFDAVQYIITNQRAEIPFKQTILDARTQLIKEKRWVQESEIS